MRAVYRVRQFWAAFTAAPGGEDLAAAGAQLGPALMALFNRLQPAEQAHSLQIYRQLLAQGENNPDLLAAALLHDVGKSRHPLRLWERVLIVLARKLFPVSVKGWGRGQPHGWRRAFVIAEQHPAWGAEMTSQAGASPRVVALIGRHQEKMPASPPATGSLEDQLLYRLQLLDDEN